ncbi:hypothetical protein J3R83DRAFT_5512 [Lanmaoa asiatica]|nr:hypothetical protein J3R83DRAFT_5512 [Lanmaoa asiatica]
MAPALSAVEACWEQFVDTIHTLTAHDDMPTVIAETPDLFDPSQHVSAHSNLKATLEKSMHVISALEAENNSLTEEVTQLRIELRTPSASHRGTVLVKNMQEMTQLNGMLDQLRASRKESEEEIQVCHQNIVLLTVLTSRKLQHRGLTRADVFDGDING